MSSSDQTPIVILVIAAFFVAFMALAAAGLGVYWWHGRYQRDLKEVCSVASEVLGISPKTDQEMFAGRAWESRLETEEMKAELRMVSLLPKEQRMGAFQDFVMSVGAGPVLCPDLEKLWAVGEKPKEESIPKPMEPSEPILRDQKLTEPLPTEGSMIILGALDKSEVEAVVKRNRAQIQYCYQRELTKNPNLAGSVTTKFVVASDGTVSAASTKKTTLNNALVEGCINGRFMRFQFPKPKGGGIAIVSYPFVFSPG